MRILKNRTKKIISGFFLSIALLSGVIIGKIIDWPFFKVDEKINLVNIFSLIVTLLIAYFIAKVIDKEKVDDREEKNLIIDKLDDTYHLIDNISEKVESKKILYIDAASKVKRINLDISCIFNALSISTISIDDEERKNILRRVKKIKNLLTDTPGTDKQTAPNFELALDVKEGFIHISDNRVIEIESEFGKLKNSIFTLQMKINSY